MSHSWSKQISLLVLMKPWHLCFCHIDSSIVSNFFTGKQRRNNFKGPCRTIDDECFKVPKAIPTHNVVSRVFRL